MTDIIFDTTKISQRGQVVIPKEVRDKLDLKAGHRLIVIASDDAIVLQRVELAGDKLRTREIMERARGLVEKLGLLR